MERCGAKLPARQREATAECWIAELKTCQSDCEHVFKLSLIPLLPVFGLAVTRVIWRLTGAECDTP